MLIAGAQNVRSGNYSVVTSNHTLILNWNDQTVPLLRQIAINRSERADNTYAGCAAVQHPTELAVSCSIAKFLGSMF
jgi:hypothetical protein